MIPSVRETSPHLFVEKEKEKEEEKVPEYTVVYDLEEEEED